MAVDMFLKLGAIEGESVDLKHKGEIDILSFSWGEANTASAAHGGGGGAGKVSMQDFHFTKQTDKASPKLFSATATGQHISQAILTVRKAGEVPMDFLKFTFTNVLVSSYQIAGSHEPDVVPTDQFSLNFQKIRFDLLTQGTKGTVAGTVSAAFDLKSQTAR